MAEILAGIFSFTLIVLVLLLFVLGARRWLVPQGQCAIMVNGKTGISTAIGNQLLDVLNHAGVSVPGACGGVGTCGLCKVQIQGDERFAKPQEKALLSRAELTSGTRLACQVSIREAMAVTVDDVCFGVSTWQCEVVSVSTLSTLIREIVLRLPAGESMNYRPGGFVQITCPPYQLDFSGIEVAEPYCNRWERDGLRDLKAGTSVPVTRAYSMANRHDDQNLVRLNIRIALPPPSSKSIPPGVVSSWLFSLQPGDTVDIQGCFGHFQVEPSDREILFIGGGVGLAPLYAQVMDLLHVQKSRQKMSLWYGARSAQELYYTEDLQYLDDHCENFEWHVSLSEPEPEDQWHGDTGFIHQVLLDRYLGAHPAPEECDYYLCGPPLMIRAVFSMLENLGVDPRSIHFDDFGGG